MKSTSEYLTSRKRSSRFSTTSKPSLSAWHASPKTLARWSGSETTTSVSATSNRTHLPVIGPSVFTVIGLCTVSLCQSLQRSSMNDVSFECTPDGDVCDVRTCWWTCELWFPLHSFVRYSESETTKSIIADICSNIYNDGFHSSSVAISQVRDLASARSSAGCHGSCRLPCDLASV